MGFIIEISVVLFCPFLQLVAAVGPVLKHWWQRSDLLKGVTNRCSNNKVVLNIFFHKVELYKFKFLVVVGINYFMDGSGRMNI